MTALIIGTSACIWCGAPVLLYLHCRYTVACPRSQKQCGMLNYKVVEKYKGKRLRYESVRKQRSGYYSRLKRASSREQRIVTELEVWWLRQTPEVQKQRQQNS